MRIQWEQQPCVSREASKVRFWAKPTISCRVESTLSSLSVSGISKEGCCERNSSCRVSFVQRKTDGSAEIPGRAKGPSTRNRTSRVTDSLTKPSRDPVFFTCHYIAWFRVGRRSISNLETKPRLRLGTTLQWPKYCIVILKAADRDLLVPFGIESHFYRKI